MASHDMQAPTHPRLAALVERARSICAAGRAPRIGIVYPCDAHALEAASSIRESGIGQPVLIGPRQLIERAADDGHVDVLGFEIVSTGLAAPGAASDAVAMARSGALDALMKGSLHTDELMSAVVNKTRGLRGETRISHAFVFDLPRYHKLLALADCVVNIDPNLLTKHDILSNAIALLQKIGIDHLKVGIVAAVETVNPAIPATVDAQALVEMGKQGKWHGTLIDGPFGLDNAISTNAALVKKINSHVAGDADLLLVPDLNAGNMLYKSFNYIGGGECAGLVLGAKIPIVLTSRADSLQSRIASVALAVLASDPSAPC